MTRECERIRLGLSDYLDGDLRWPARRRTARHLVRCPECGRLFASLTRAVEGLHSLARSSPAVRGSVARSVVERIRQERMGA